MGKLAKLRQQLNPEPSIEEKITPVVDLASMRLETALTKISKTQHSNISLMAEFIDRSLQAITKSIQSLQSEIDSINEQADERQALLTEISEKLLKEQKKVVTFQIIRDNEGWIESVIATENKPPKKTPIATPFKGVLT